MKKLHALFFSLLTGSAMTFATLNKLETPLSQRAHALVKQMNLGHTKWENLHWEKYIIEENLIAELPEKTFIEFGDLANGYIRNKATHEPKMMLEKSRYPANSLVPSYFSVVQELEKTETTLTTLYYDLNREIGKKVKDEDKRLTIVKSLIW